MDRRSFLKTSALGGSAAAATALAAPAYAQGNRTLTMVTTWGRGLAGVFDAAQRVADNVTAMTDGALTIDVKAAGELVGAFEVFDAVTAGQADMYHGADYYFVGQHPGYAFFTAVPFGMTAQELANWYYFDGGMELRVTGVDKGTAVRQVLADTRSSHADGALLAYLGDDMTDEDAFRALGDEGFSILVRDQLRPTAAGSWLRPPGELLRFLERWLDLRSRDTGRSSS